MKRDIVKVLALLLVLSMALPMTAFAAATYDVTVTIESDGEGYEPVSGSLTTQSGGTKLAEALGQLVLSKYEKLKEVFGSPAMKRLMDEGLAIAKPTGSHSESSWTEYSEKYNYKTPNDAALEAKLADYNTTIADVGVGTHVVTFENTVFGDPKYGETYTVTIGISEHPTGGGGGGGGTIKPVKEVEVPVSGDDHTIKVKAQVSESEKEAKLVIPGDKLETVINEDVKTGTVEIDLTPLEQEIKAVVIPGETLKAIVEAANDDKNDVDGLTIKMDDGILTFDVPALNSIDRQAENHDLRLVIDDTTEVNIQIMGQDSMGLNEEQIKNLQDYEKLAVYDIYMTVDGERIKDFEGGAAEVTVRHKLAEGQKTEGLTVLYVADDGKISKMPFVIDGNEVVFTVTHFSNYVITYDRTGTASERLYRYCPRDVTCPIEPFTDTLNDYWWHDGIHFCVENGLMVGFPGSIFLPRDPLSRAQIVMILWRMEGSPVANYAMSFLDVGPDNWYTEAIRWAQSTGVVLGYSDAAFGPNDNVTREQLAAILYRYAAYKGLDMSEKDTLLRFADYGTISAWALENVKWAVAVGMIEGRTETTIVPRGDTTRAEAAAMIQRFIVNVLHADRR